MKDCELEKERFIYRLFIGDDNRNTKVKIMVEEKRQQGYISRREVRSNTIR